MDTRDDVTLGRGILMGYEASLDSPGVTLCLGDAAVW